MNDLTVNQRVSEFIDSQKDNFLLLNNGALTRLSFENEADFARQQLTKNQFSLDVARHNKQSLMDAIGNVASVGLSLNPAYSYAYLVPRKINKVDSICLDISYRGLIRLATDTGIIEYMKAEMVHENDDFEYHGFNQKPTLKANPFKDRGAMLGCYAMAKLKSGDYLVETMTSDEILAIREDSEVYKSAKRKGGWQLENCVWVKYFGEMVKKTVIKRLYKTLPQTDGSDHLGNAISVINQHEGIEFNQEPVEIEYTSEQSDEYKRCIDSGDYLGLVCLKESMIYEAQNQLFDLHEAPNIPQGQKGKYGEAMKQHESAARDLRESNLQSLREACDSGDSSTISEIWGEAGTFECDWYIARLNPEQSTMISEVAQ